MIVLNDFKLIHGHIDSNDWGRKLRRFLLFYLFLKFGKKAILNLIFTYSNINLILNVSLVVMS